MLLSRKTSVCSLLFRRSLGLAFIALTTGFLTSQRLVAQPISTAPPVDLEVVTGGTLGVTEQQAWYEALQEVRSIRLRLVRGTGRDQPKIEDVGTERRPQYRVTAVLDNRGRLVVPGGSFTKRDVEKITAWIKRLQDEGPDGVTSPRGAFGLTSKQLETAHAASKAIVNFETEGRQSHEVVAQLQQLFDGVTVKIDPLAEGKLHAPQKVLDELKGLSVGTALTAVLRPLGLAVTVRYDRGQLHFVVIDPVKHEGEVWPIGWVHKGSKKEAAPTLFNNLTVEIGAGTSLATILESVTARIKIPVLYDHNALARDGLELTELTAKFPERRTYYMRVLESTLGQVQLKPFLRLDEANQPFLWITTAKPGDRPAE